MTNVSSRKMRALVGFLALTSVTVVTLPAPSADAGWFKDNVADPVRNAVQNVGNAIGQGVQTVGQGATGLFVKGVGWVQKKIIDPIKEKLGDLWDSLTGELQEVIYKYKEGGIKGVLHWALGKIPGYNLVEGALKECQGNLSLGCVAPEIAKGLPESSNIGGFIKSLGGGFQGVVNWAASKLQNSDLGQLLGAFKKAPGDKGQALIDWAKEKFTEVFDKLVSIFPWLAKIKDFITALKNYDWDTAMKTADHVTSTIMSPIILVMGPGAVIPMMMKSMAFKFIGKLLNNKGKFKLAAKAVADDLKESGKAFKDAIKRGFEAFKCPFLKPSQVISEGDAPDPQPFDAEAKPAVVVEATEECGSTTIAELKGKVKVAAGNVAKAVGEAK